MHMHSHVVYLCILLVVFVLIRLQALLYAVAQLHQLHSAREHIDNEESVQYTRERRHMCLPNQRDSMV
jgi:hypothetical protein